MKLFAMAYQVSPRMLKRTQQNLQIATWSKNSGLTPVHEVCSYNTGWLPLLSMLLGQQGARDPALSWTNSMHIMLSVICFIAVLLATQI